MLIQWHEFLRVNGKPMASNRGHISPVSAQNLLRHPDGQRRERPPKQRPIAPDAAWTDTLRLVIRRSEIQAPFFWGASETDFFFKIF